MARSTRSHGLPNLAAELAEHDFEAAVQADRFTVLRGQDRTGPATLNARCAPDDSPVLSRFVELDSLEVGVHDGPRAPGS